ncbi:MAG: nickel pincer cofactor biosynthesis protein LarC [Opitutales bacterium]|nr:nickel pincer cofactor biosynthesis protein LarC [Opitutales bacterium]
MKVLYYDCFAGISGDMNIAAFVDLGIDKDALIKELQKLNLSGWQLKFSRDMRGGISGTKAEVIDESCVEHAFSGHSPEHGHLHARTHSHEHGHSHFHRSYADIKKIIENSNISQRAKNYALKIFEKIALAEAKVHNKNMGEVCFHEVGAIDSIIDIVAAAVCADMLGVDKFVCSAIELGGGTVKCAHGVMPVPAPATAEIVKGLPVKFNGAMHECTTPTGAAIIASLCGGFSEKISGKIIANGVGIGHRNSPELPNILRISLIESEDSCSLPLERERMSVVECNIDDMPAEDIAHLCEKLFSAGALDVWQEGISMKKSRLGTKVCALAPEKDAEKVAEFVFENSTTLGVRLVSANRLSLSRKCVNFKSSLGEVNFKVAEFNGKTKAKPEFDDCKKISDKTGRYIGVVRKTLCNEFENR